MHTKILASAALAALVSGCGSHGGAGGGSAAEPSLERGRYLVQIAGCNDCHTHDYILTAGKVDEKDWLKGDTLGWNGPWGTTYAPNLRLKMQALTEEEWLQFAASAQLRPPMPWYALRQMSQQDLRSIYRFIRTLEPAGSPVLPALAPGAEPSPPYFKLVLPPEASPPSAAPSK